MKLVSHAHINGNGPQFRDEYARILARAAKKRKYTHVVVGCHGHYIASESTMKAVRQIGITPIRFAELDLKVDGNTHDHSHVALINIPNKPMPKLHHAHIDTALPYIKETGCKVVLCHPRSLAEINAWAQYIDGYEIMNGLDRYQRRFTTRDASKQLPNLKQFIGADYHVWEGAGDMDYFTQLPDNWFGKLYG
jgi:hypothetical protein